MALTRQGLFAALEPVVQAAGYELVELETVGQGADTVLRLYIDRLPGDTRPAPVDTEEAPAQGGISVDDCADVSRAVSDWLDEHDPIPGQYYLEVSSPGFDRPLRTPAHFAAQLGQRAKVELAVAIEARRRFTGTLVAVEGGELVMEVDGRTWRLPLDGISRARVVPAY